MDKTIFDFSMSQTNIWNLENRYVNTPMNVISCTVEITGQMNFELLQNALNLILKSDSSLRVQIRKIDGNAVQCEMPWQNTVFPTYDFSQSDEKAFLKWEQMMAREPIPLEDGPLYRFVMFRTGERSGGVLVKMHHIISDGWTQMMICNRIASVYLDLISGEEVSLSESPSYYLHVCQEQEYLESRMMQKDKEYWEKQFSVPWQPALLKTEPGMITSPLGHRISYQLSEVLGHKIHRFCMENRVSPFLVFYLAFAVYLNRKENISRFSIGVPLYNRNTRQDRETTGMFVSTLPFLCDVREDMTVSEAMEHIALEWFEMMRHQKLPYEMISNLAFQKQPGSERLFYIALSYQDSKMMTRNDTSVTFAGEWFYSGYQSEHLCIHLHNREKQNQFCVNYDYLLQVFSQNEIEDLHQSLTGILDEITEYPDRTLAEVEVMRPEEKEQVLYAFNQTERYVPEQTICEALTEVVEEHSNRVALICDGRKISYKELFDMGGRIAAGIRKTADRGEVVAILLPRGNDLFAAMVGAVRAGCTWVLISRQLPEYRVQKILKQSGASVVVTDASGKYQYHCLEEYHCVSPEAVYTGEQIEDREQTDGDTSLYIVYTSGSTGEPKGVEIGQRAFLNFSRAMKPYYSQRAVLSVCNIGFDAFLIESMAALLNGRTIVIAVDEEVEKPASLAELIVKYGVGFLSVTPSRLQAWMANQHFRSALRGIDRIICGGEAFPAELVNRLEPYTSAHVFNQYGPSEATVGVCIKCMNYADQVTIGRPMDNCRAYILNQDKKPLPVGARGHLYLGGLCLAEGYRGNENLTEEKFVANPYEWQERIYDTGDIAAWNHSGEIVLYGRSDRQIKLRGLRIELEEIAGCLAAYPGIVRAHIRICRSEEREWLCAYYVSESQPAERELREFLLQRLPVYMLPEDWIRVREFPLNANGKVEESALPFPEHVAGQDSPQNAIQQQILDIFTESLHGVRIGVSDDYFRFGGNSLSMMSVLANLEEIYKVALLPMEFFANPSVLSLEKLIRHRLHTAEDGTGQAEGYHLGPAPRMELYPASALQRAMYVQSHMRQGEYMYHMPGIFFLENRPEEERFWQAVQKLVDTEEMLRTGFVVTEEGVFQKVSEKCRILPSYLTADTLEAAKEQFLRPFQLSEPPLMHCALWYHGEQTAVFLDLHHLISDGMSTPILLNRLSGFYENGSASVPEIFFKDVVYAQQKQDKKEYHKKYWENQLSGYHRLSLLTDFARKEADLALGADYRFCVESKQTSRIREWCQKQGMTEYMLFAGAFAMLLSTLGGTGDVTVGTPVAGRHHPQLMDICGPFLHSLPLRLRVEKTDTVQEYLEQVKENVYGLLEHQQMDASELEKMCGEEIRPGENPFYSVFFSMRPMDASELTFAGERLRYEAIDTERTKFELSLEIAPEGDGYLCWFQYAKELFLPETIAFYGRCMIHILEVIMDGTDRLLQNLSLIPKVDEMYLIRDPMDEHLPFADRRIEQQLGLLCQMMPEETALIWHGQKICRREFLKRAEQIAGSLQAQNAGSDDVIGICCRRTPDMLAAMVGVLMTGAAYMPMLPNYPQRRMIKMCESADITYVLCDERGRHALPEELSEYALSLEEMKGDRIPVPDGEKDRRGAFCVLFTSGSTGEPKGAVLTHYGVNNVFANLKDLYKNTTGNVLCTTNMIFDTFLAESLLAWMAGKTVVLADEEEMMLPWKVAKLTEDYHVTWMQMTPSRMKVCMENEEFCDSLQKIEHFITAGEVLSQSLTEQIYSVSGQIKIVNLYGPTEGTIYATREDVRQGCHVNIGKPLYNNRIYLLDEQRRPVLPTAVGEIYLAGACVTEGYINRPEETEQAYLPDLYAEGERMYRTGDLGRLRMDGTIDFYGRLDHQVKLNGQRIELDEIVSAMKKSHLVKQAVVVPIMEEGRTRSLRAFYVPEDREVPAEKFREILGRDLPSYMIPAMFLPLREIPLTATGKADLVYLQSDAFAENPVLCREPDVPSEEIEIVTQVDELRALWCRVLERERIDENQSFFEQGGTSLAAMQVLAGYYDRGIQMTMEDFFRIPVFREQMEQLQMVPEDRAECRSMPEPVIQEMIPEKSYGEGGAILLTGATGFLGAHLLYELLRQVPEEQEVICLVRKSSLKKISDIWAYYFGTDWMLQTRKRVKIEIADLMDEKLGLSEDHYLALAERISEIYHCAADVRHYAADDSILRTNVNGTRHMLSLAQRAQAAFQYVSTLSVGGSVLPEFPDTYILFEEEDYDLGQNWEENQYVKSKFLAEGLVRDAFCDGMKGHIFRIGRLVGRASDGKFQRNAQTNAFYRTIREIRELPCIPENFGEIRVDLTPVDTCAAEILALHESKMQTLHLMGDIISLKDLMLQLWPQREVCGEEAFQNAVAAKRQTGAEEQMGNLCQQMIYRKIHPVMIEPSDVKTREELKNLEINIQHPEISVLLKEFIVEKGDGGEAF